MTVRFTGGKDEPDLDVWVESRESVARVKDKVRPTVWSTVGTSGPPASVKTAPPARLLHEEREATVILRTRAGLESSHALAASRIAPPTPMA